VKMRRAGDGNRTRMTSLEESVRSSHRRSANALVSKGFGGSRPGLRRVLGRNLVEKSGYPEVRGGWWSRVPGSEWRSVVLVTFPLGVRVVPRPVASPRRPGGRAFHVCSLKAFMSLACTAQCVMDGKSGLSARQADRAPAEGLAIVRFTGVALPRRRTS
jgi:hypothetical protein